jgi:hypothetical protein
LEKPSRAEANPCFGKLLGIDATKLYILWLGGAPNTIGCVLGIDKALFPLMIKKVERENLSLMTRQTGLLLSRDGTSGITG